MDQGGNQKKKKRSTRESKGIRNLELGGGGGGGGG